MEINNMRIPLLIGGATTSALHTAVKIAPCYGGPVVYTRDAAMMPSVAQRLINPSTHDEAVAENEREQQRLRREHVSSLLMPLSDARKNAPALAASPVRPLHPGIHCEEISVADARLMINWRAFLSAWKLDASFAEVMELQGCDHCKAQWLARLPQDKVKKGAEAMQLLKEAVRALDALENMALTLKAKVAILPAHRDGDDIVVCHNDKEVRLPMLAPADDRGEFRFSCRFYRSCR